MNKDTFLIETCNKLHTTFTGKDFSLRDIRTQLPELDSGSLPNIIKKLVAKGELVRVYKGRYRISPYTASDVLWDTFDTLYLGK